MSEKDGETKIKVGKYSLTKFEIFGLSMVGVALLPLLSLIVVEAFRLVAPALGLPLSNCSEGDFWLNGLYGVVLSAVVFALIPSTVPFGLGVTRAMHQKKYGYTGMAIGAVLTILNLSIGWETLHWYSETSNRTIAETASIRIQNAALAVEEYKGDTGIYPESIDKLKSDFTFMSTGHIIITDIKDGCFILHAEHECLTSTVVWDSCNGGLRPIKELHEEDLDDRIG